MDVHRSGSNGICCGCKVGKVTISTAISVMLANKAGRTDIAVGPGFSNGALAVGKCLIPCGRDDMFRKAA